jgi:large subunit ribosomal protein L1
MGRPKVKIIDDSQPTEEVKKTPETKVEEKKAPRRFGRQDDLVAKLQEELGISDTKPTKPSEEVKEIEKKETKPVKKAVTKKAAKITRSKKYQTKVAELNGEPAEGEESAADFRIKIYKLEEAIELVKKSSYSKFTGTLEAHINTSSTGLRGHITLPFASGKKLRVVAFGNGAEESGADIIGDDKLLEEIKAGKINFDILVTTPAWMPKLAPLARVLGPKGLMPNPKSGTITDDLKKAVEGYLAGKTEYKTESKAPVMHLAMGKLDQPTEELSANVKTLLQTLGKSRVKKIALAPTMGPAVKLDLSSI